MKSWSGFYAVICICVCALSAQTARAQSVPTDLLDVSLEALLSAPVIDDGDRHGEEGEKWHLSYSFQLSHHEGYYQDSDKLDSSALLWNPKEGPRGSEEFLAITPEITQDVHALSLGYELDGSNTLTAIVPWIHQTTEHKTIIPGFTEFSIDTKNLGDINLLWDRVFHRSLDSHWLSTLGISMPTGSIDETGPTPQGPGSAVPYTMQTGSGTWDIPFSLTYVKQGGGYRWGLGGKGLYRVGENDNGYTLGNRLGGSLWALMTDLQHVEPGLKLNWEWQDRIDGADRHLPRPDSEGRYPTPVVDPSRYGGHRIDLGVFARVFFDARRRYHGDLEFSKPIYQDLNGPQVATRYRLGIRLGMEF